MELEWDDAKAAANRAKHGVSFEFAVRIFGDPHRLEIEDERFAYGEARAITLGQIDGCVFVVVCTWRGGRCRMISARKANVRESRRYHDLQA